MSRKAVSTRPGSPATSCAGAPTSWLPARSASHTRRSRSAQPGGSPSWQWAPVEDTDDDGDEDDLNEDGEWVLRAHAPITAQEVAGHLPESLLQWVRRMTLGGAESMAELAESEPQFADAARRLRAESDRLP
jgi:hypothetical protein